MKWIIRKLEADLVWKTTHEFTKSEKAERKIKQMAERYNWKWISTRSLFNGHYVDQDGNCYEVA